MKNLSWILGFVLFCSTNVTADYNDNSCCPTSDCNPCKQDSCCDGDFGFHADLLYWQVCRSDLDLATQASAPSKDKYINPGYEFGFRIGANYQCDCWDLGVRWTSFDNDWSKKFPGQDNVENAVKARYEIDYDVVDFEAGHNLQLCCANKTVKFRPFAGVKLAYIDERFSTNLEDNSPSFNGGFKGNAAKFNYEGYGLYLGSAFDAPLWCDSHFVSRASVGILSGDFESKGGSELRGDECSCIPVLEVQAGLAYETECGCWNTNFFVGWEGQYYGWRDNGSNDRLAHLSLNGLVVRLGSSF